MNQYIFPIIALMICFAGCNNADSPEKETGNKISLEFVHLVDNAPLERYTMKYVNTAGNSFEIDELKYFISDVVLYKSDGQIIPLNGWKDIHYVDIDHPVTLKWEVFDDIPEGNYESIKFVFGISSEKNQSMMFVNPPESEMMWPDSLGGGYHYLMINGKWKDLNQQTKPFYCHLGIGKVTDCCGTRYIHNCFTVNLSLNEFSLDKKETRAIKVIMNINRWFNQPYTYDHNEYGSDIMGNQEAMFKISENGRDVFEVEY